MTKNLIIAFLIIVIIGLTLIMWNKSSIIPNNTDSTQQESTEDKHSVNELPENKGPDNSLDLSSQQLNELPKDVLAQTDLQILDISNNNIKQALPAEIKNLKSLIVLNASNNNMTGVPAEIGQLDNLEVLDLSNNELTGLPYELGNLKKLKTLNLSGNNYSKQDLEIIKQGLPSDTEIIL